MSAVRYIACVNFWYVLIHTYQVMHNPARDFSLLTIFFLRQLTCSYKNFFLRQKTRR